MANNIAILGIAYANPGCHIITSKIEHKSVTNVCKHLESQGYTVTYLDVDRLGRVDIDKLYKGIQKNTQLITIQMFNSEIGTLQNVKAIGEIAKKRGIPFHSDAAQAFCRYDINVDELNVDLLTISGHKIGTPTGVAALYARDVSKLQPILFGSGERLFPGTKPTALIAALAVAVEHFQFDKTKIEKNYNALVSALLKIKDVYINSSSPSHVVSVSIGGVLLKDLLERIKDYSFSAGCSCLGQGKSNVLEAIDPDGLLPVCTIRLSFTDRVDETVLVKFAQKLEEVVRELRKEKDIGAGCPSGEKGKAGYFGVLA
jgi:cysteine desulfurase